MGGILDFIKDKPWLIPLALGAVAAAPVALPAIGGALGIGGAAAGAGAAGAGAAGTGAALGTFGTAAEAANLAAVGGSAAASAAPAATGIGSLLGGAGSWMAAHPIATGLGGLALYDALSPKKNYKEPKEKDDPMAIQEKFPVMSYNAPPANYDPTSDGEWNYFNWKGITEDEPPGRVKPASWKKFAGGGEIDTEDMSGLFEEALKALAGEGENPDMVLMKLHQMIGDEAFQEFIATAQGDAGDESAMAPEEGRRVRGPGGGLADLVPAVINDQAPARLSDGEFVIPADVVSGLGDGSTDAGSDALHGLIERVRSKRTGSKAQPKALDHSKVMPA